MQISNPVDQSQSITSQLSNVHDLRPNRRLNSVVHRLPLKPFTTSGLVGEGGADPRLDIAHSELKIVTSELRHLGNGAGEGVDGVAELFQTVVKGGEVLGRDAVGVGELEDFGGGGLDGGEGDREGGGGQKAGAFLDGTGVD